MRNQGGTGARSARLTVAAAIVAVGTSLLAACGPRGDRAGHFCALVKSDQPALTAGVKGDVSIDKVVDQFHDLERTAPIAIEADWAKLTDLVEAAAAIQPGDADAQARLTTAAYEANESVQNVVGWVRATCGVDLTVPASAATTAPAAPTTTSAAPTTIR